MKANTTKLEAVIRSMFETQNKSWTDLNSVSKYDVICKFYKDNNIAIPASITFENTPNVENLNKDTKIALLSALSLKQLSGETLTETETDNLKALIKGTGKIDVSETLTMKQALESEKFGYNRVANYLRKALAASNPAKYEELQNIRAFEEKPMFAVTQIDAIIAQLQTIKAEQTK